MQDSEMMWVEAICHGTGRKYDSGNNLEEGSRKQLRNLLKKLERTNCHGTGNISSKLVQLNGENFATRKSVQFLKTFGKFLLL